MTDRPHLLWDGECGFCRRWVDYWEEMSGDAVTYSPYQQQPDLMAEYGLDEIETSQAIHLLMPDGRVFSGAQAAVETLRRGEAARFMFYADAYRVVPGVSDIMEAVYRWVAQRRVGAARVTRWLWGAPHRSTFATAQFLFTRLLALSAFIAFWSLSLQVTGLFGEHGILPVSDFLAQATAWARQTGVSAPATFPSVLWVTGAGDSTLEALCLAGMLTSAALFVGVVPRLMVPMIWVLYLSVVSVGQVFLGYQWDGLLLESLFVGFFFVPRRLVPARSASPETGGRWLVWLLTFKLMFLAGWVKVAAHDSAWTDFTALDFHFWTQPIPNWVAWYADRLPDALKALGVAFTLGVELFAPLLIFAPRRLRHLGALLLIALQLAIMATGTYGFFNVLTIALCASLFDDAFFGRLAVVHEGPARAYAAPRRAAGAVVVALLVPIVTFTTLLPTPIREVLGPLRTFNGYGLFADMTRERPEIIVQWSHDGMTWTPYDFEYKPTSVDEPLRFTTLHMPRLDWQMWFAALRGCRRATWLLPFAERLLEGAPEVHALLEGKVPNEPPRFVKMSYFAYSFGTDSVWERSERGEFCPTVTLDEHGSLVLAEQ